MDLIVTTPAKLAQIVSDAVAVAIRNYTPATQPDKMLTAEEAAEFLQVNRSTVYELTRLGKMPHRKIGKVVRYSRKELEAFSFDREAEHAESLQRQVAEELKSWRRKKPAKK